MAKRNGNGNPRMTGTVQRVVPERGFGFIRDTAGVDYFFHRSACSADLFALLQQGTAVTFLSRQTDKGPRAEEVALVDSVF